MSDGFRGLVTALTSTDGTVTAAQISSGAVPETDRIARYTKEGLLPLRTPPSFCGVTRPAAGITTIEEARAANHHPLLYGSYFSADRTLEPFLIGPNRLILWASAAALAGITWTFPSAADLLDYVKDRYGTDAIRPGFGWSLKVINNTIQNMTLDLTAAGLEIVGPSAGGTYVIDPAGDIKVRTLTFFVVTLNTGSEAVSVLIE